MSDKAAKIGAVFYFIWGILHVIGGFIMLKTINSDGGAAMLAMLGNGLPPDQIPNNVAPITKAALQLISWDLVWSGILVSYIAIKSNWKNRRTGYWLNFFITSSMDIPYIAVIVFSGYTVFPRGFMGPVSWVLALIFSTAALLIKIRVANKVQ